ncbi:MAG: hypothetical protein VXY16_04995 [Pseudomonadota bacterium]|nr:hypothetical protein [Pseudomonadota bacterium]
MAIFAATELDRFASDILTSRGVTSVFAEQSAGTTHEPAETAATAVNAIADAIAKPAVA